MAGGQTESSSEKADRAKDQRLRKKFGITLEDFNRRREEQHHACKCCGRALIQPPHVDHLHFKIRAERNPIYSGWDAWAYHDQFQFIVGPCWENTKQAAIDRVRALAMPLSIRGILCSQCNRGLGKLEDPRFFHGDPVRIRQAADYLESFRLTKQ